MLTIIFTFKINSDIASTKISKQEHLEVSMFDDIDYAKKPFYFSASESI